jgi:hydrogenase 3 maturation protease
MKEQNNETGKELKGKIEKWFSRFNTVVIAGIGNSLRKDDFVGVEVVRQLKNKVPPNVHIIECETVPESFIQSIEELNPSHVLIIDAALINSNPGDSKLVDSKELQEKQAISTHALPLRIFCEYLLQTTEAKIALLAIQPQDTSFGEGLTEILEYSAKQLAELLLRILRE